MTDNKTNGDEGASYRGSELIGMELEGRSIGPKEMLRKMEGYEELLRAGNYDEAEKIERDEGLPDTWLTGVISSLIKERNGLSSKLIKRFANRGYGEAWAKEYVEDNI
jgi:hypothetical protein